MKCKNCNEGLQLKTLAHRLPNTNGEAFLIMEPVACDCCGGYFEDCENCKAGCKVIEWVSDEEYPAALEKYNKAKKK
jgi:hypothetical protein